MKARTGEEFSRCAVKRSGRPDRESEGFSRRLSAFIAGTVMRMVSLPLGEVLDNAA